MRVPALLGPLAFSAGALLFAGCPTCPSADRAEVVVPPGSPGQAPRFVASSSLGGSSQLTLLDSALRPISFRVPPPSGTETQSWISNRSRWANMRGTGIGTEPVLAPALTPGVPGLVTIAGATSVIALGLPSGREDWEWVEAPLDDGTLIPVNDVVVVTDATDELHDVAVVARDRVENGTNPFGGSLTVGGDLRVLDVESNRPTLLGTVPLDGLADSGLELTPRGMAVAGGLVYAALDHGLEIGPDGSPVRLTGDGIVVAFDPETRMVRSVLRLTGLTNCEHIVALGGEPPTGRVVVACAGTPETPGEIPDDAALVIIDRDPMGMEAPVVTQTLPASLLAIPSPDGALVALRGSSVAFVSAGSSDEPPLEDRLYVVDVATEATDLLASFPADSEASPGGLGSGAYDPVAAADGSTLFAVAAGRAGLLPFRLVPDAAMPELFTIVEGEPVVLTTCSGLPVRDLRLVP